MPNFICTTCGSQFAESPQPPQHCEICQDARQFIGQGGQQWTMLDQLQQTHRNTIHLEEPGLIGIGMEPAFAIGQRALLIRTGAGNILWDCTPLLDAALIEFIKGNGGLAAIAISHPHYYSSMVEWAHVFHAPLYLHAADQQWVMRPDRAIEFWDGDTRPLPGGCRLIRCGGHFAGGTVLHWPAGANHRGAILSGDILQVVEDCRWVSFMYSYPNYIPLPASKVQHIAKLLEPFAFDRIYGAWWGRCVATGGHQTLANSAQRYVQAIKEEPTC
jgi:hypothetical protein